MNDPKKGAKDLALIKGTVEGNIGSFDLLFKNYYEGLLSFAKELLPYPSDEAEDIICDMFESLWANRNQLQVKTSIASYLYISVRNRVYDHFKKNKVITLELQEGNLDYSTY